MAKDIITCEECNAKCCRYVTVPIDEPEDNEDFDHIKWLVIHENVEVCVDNDGDWLVCFHTPCKKIDENTMCSDYENRPDICRDHGIGECLMNGEGEDFQFSIKSVEDLEEYIKSKNVKNVRKRKR